MMARLDPSMAYIVIATTCAVALVLLLILVMT